MITTESLVVVHPDKAGHRTLHGVTNVVHIELIAVVPPVHVADCFYVSGKQWVMQCGSRSRLGSNPKRIHDQHELKGIAAEAAPIGRGLWRSSTFDERAGGHVE